MVLLVAIEHQGLKGVGNQSYRILKVVNNKLVQRAPGQEGLGRIDRKKESKGRTSEDLGRVIKISFPSVHDQTVGGER